MAPRWLAASIAGREAATLVTEKAGFVLSQPPVPEVLATATVSHHPSTLKTWIVTQTTKGLHDFTSKNLRFYAHKF